MLTPTGSLSRADDHSTEARSIRTQAVESESPPGLGEHPARTFQELQVPRAQARMMFQFFRYPPGETEVAKAIEPHWVQTNV